MDILDEIDAAINEKKSKWKYTPMREKSETDALIDELLREFPSGGYQSRRTEAAPPKPKTTDNTSEQTESIAGKVQTALKNKQQAKEALEEQEAESDVEETAEKENLNAAVQSEYGSDSESAVDDSNEYNDYVSRKYADLEYEEESYDEEDERFYDEDDEEPEYNDDEYDGEDDDFKEYEEEPPVGKGGNKNSSIEFNRFMDAENDGEKGDISRFPISSILLTILKIALLAAFGAFAVVGVINTIDNNMDRFGKSESSQEDTLKDKLQSVITPVIVTETEDFESASELSDEQLVDIAVWEIVINGNKSVFLNSDSEQYNIPQEQIAYVVEKLFGSEIKFSHTDSEIENKKITYDQEKGHYEIPEDTDLYTLYPEVTDVAQTGDVYTVYADCYGSYPVWSSVKVKEAEKRVMITLKKTSDYYNITSMKTIPLN